MLKCSQRRLNTYHATISNNWSYHVQIIYTSADLTVRSWTGWCCLTARPTATKLETSVQDCVSAFGKHVSGWRRSLFNGNRVQMFVIRLLGNLQLKVGYFKRDVGTISSCFCGNRTSQNINFSYPWPQWFLCLTWNCTPKLRFNITRVYGYGRLGWVIVNNQSIGQIKHWRQRQGFIF